MLTRELWRGGGVAVTLSGTATRNLIDSERWLLLVVTGSGGATIYLPYSVGMPIGTVFHITLTGSSAANSLTIRDFADIANQGVYDHQGALQTSIDFSTTKWTVRPAIECRLINTDLGLWLCYSRGNT